MADIATTVANFVHLLEDIADAIRAKDYTAADIPAYDFPSRILAIPTGGGSSEDEIDYTLKSLVESAETLSVSPATYSFATWYKYDGSTGETTEASPENIDITRIDYDVIYFKFEGGIMSLVTSDMLMPITVDVSGITLDEIDASKKEMLYDASSVSSLANITISVLGITFGTEQQTIRISNTDTTNMCLASTMYAEKQVEYELEYDAGLNMVFNEILGEYQESGV